MNCDPCVKAYVCSVCSLFNDSLKISNEHIVAVELSLKEGLVQKNMHTILLQTTVSSLKHVHSAKYDVFNVSFLFPFCCMKSRDQRICGDSLNLNVSDVLTVLYLE